MKRLTILFAVLAVFLWVGNAWATNITIDDNRNDGGTGWYGAHEDQEVEPDMVANQSWDLEGFFLNGTILTMVGGFDFRDGNLYGGYTYTSGDIFLDVGGDATYGDTGTYGPDSINPIIRNGYDYVIDLDFSSMKYNVYSIDNNAVLSDVYDYNSPKSSPWKYVDEGTLVLANQPLDYTDFGTLTDGETGFFGDTHNAVSVDLAWLVGLGYTEFTSHFTMECGNDNLMGHGTIPEPATMLLFGTGLIGMAVIGRKKLLKKQG